ncbi:hypothetical protein REPUB_Repub03eG0259800 [Reevesia pubescens]
MAANSALLAVQYAAGLSVPRFQLRRNLVTKTHKTTIMAANPAMQCEASDLVSIPDLTLDDKIFWAGGRSVKPPRVIHCYCKPFGFKQDADSEGSIGAVEYVFPGDEYKWIIAWSNPKNDLNKVYTQILPHDADWIEIRENLNKSGQISIFDGYKHNVPFSSVVEIDRTRPKPTMTANILPIGVYKTGIVDTNNHFTANIVNKYFLENSNATGATSDNGHAAQPVVQKTTAAATP